MNKYTGGTAFCLVLAAILLNQPALAIDVGASVSVGGFSAGADAEASGGGVSAGVSASAGSADVSAGADAEASRGGVSAGVSASAGSADVSAAGAISTSGGTISAGQVAPDIVAPGGTTPAALAPASRTPLTLPIALRRCPQAAPCETHSSDGETLDERTPRFAVAVAALSTKLGAPLEIVTACRNGIIQAALPFDPVRVDAVSAGALQRTKDGGQAAPLMVRIVYDRQGGYETMEAEVTCRVDVEGNVVALV